MNASGALRLRGVRRTRTRTSQGAEALNSNRVVFTATVASLRVQVGLQVSERHMPAAVIPVPQGPAPGPVKYMSQWHHHWHTSLFQVLQEKVSFRPMRRPVTKCNSRKRPGTGLTAGPGRYKRWAGPARPRLSGSSSSRRLKVTDRVISRESRPGPGFGAPA